MHQFFTRITGELAIGRVGVEQLAVHVEAQVAVEARGQNAAQGLVAFAQRFGAFLDLPFEACVQARQFGHGLLLLQPVKSIVGEHTGELRVEPRDRLDALLVEHRHAGNGVEVARLVKAELLCLAAEEVHVRLFGQKLPGEQVGDVHVVDHDRRRRVDQSVEAAIDRVGRPPRHALDERRIALQAAAAGVRIDAMKTGAGELPAGAGEDGAVNIEYRVGDADDLIEAVHQGLQLRNVDELRIGDPMNGLHGRPPHSGRARSCGFRSYAGCLTGVRSRVERTVVPTPRCSRTPIDGLPGAADSAFSESASGLFDFPGGRRGKVTHCDRRRTGRRTRSMAAIRGRGRGRQGGLRWGGRSG